MNNEKPPVILVVDDEPEIRALISDFLEDDEGYAVLNARNGQEALETVLPNHHVDLVLSDINMPVMKGFELLSAVRGRWPHVKRVLITAYNVEDYIELALAHDVGNIFAKTTPFHFVELAALLKTLLSGDIFGAQRYFSDEAGRQSLTITRGDRIDKDARAIMQTLPEDRVPRKLNLVLVELLTNAIFYGIRREKPDRKEDWTYDFELLPEEAIQVTTLCDAEKYAISIMDRGGRLTKKDYLYWLHRQVARDENGMPLGVYDSHGRGFYIARKYIDRLIINIDPGVKTEVVIVNYFNEVFVGSKPLYINEL
jgi:CheY-like chemotaxis protein